VSFWPYIPAVAPCSGKAQKGTANLQQAILDRFDRALDYGIYNCRPLTTNASVPSIHSDGRAGDTGFPVVGGKAHAQGFALVEVLKANAHELGIMGIIWNRLRWSAKSPMGGKYTGPNPHIDHVHWEQVPSIAVSLTLDDAYRLIGFEEAEMTLKVPDRGNAVRAIQQALNKWQPALNVVEDGIYGPGLTAAVKTYQQSADLPVTGEVDGVTAALLLTGPDQV
jgi:hypothetical protein